MTQPSFISIIKIKALLQTSETFTSCLANLSLVIVFSLLPLALAYRIRVTHSHSLGIRLSHFFPFTVAGQKYSTTSGLILIRSHQILRPPTSARMFRSRSRTLIRHCFL